MKKSNRLRISITLLMLAAAACVLVGKSVVHGPGFTLSYNYIDSLFPAADSAWKRTAVSYSWSLLTSGIIASVLVWVRKTWMVPITAFVCLSSTINHVIRCALEHYSVFQIDGVWEFFMLVLPLASMALCLWLLCEMRKE